MLTVDIPAGNPLTEFTNELKTHIISSIERSQKILIEEIAIIIDKILPEPLAS